MRIHTFEQSQKLPVSQECVWAFFSTPGNLDELTPKGFGLKPLHPLPEKIHEGLIITYQVKIAPFVRTSWITEIKCVEEGRAFVDEQRIGPFKFWHHRHVFETIEGGVLVKDTIHYVLPFGLPGEIAHAVFVKKKLRCIFDFRKEALAKHFGVLSLL